MAVISGRYGSVQRLLPVAYDTYGKPQWQQLDPSAVAPFTEWNTIANGGGGPAGMRLTGDEHDGMAVSGTEGSGTTVSSVTSWSLENTVTTVPFIASNTRGYKGQLEGLHSCTGNISGLGGLPPIAPGQRFKFLGYVGPTSGRLNDLVGHVYSITAIANSVQVQINYQMSNPITWTIGWMSDWKYDGDELLHNQYRRDTVSSDVWTAVTESITGFWDYTQPPTATMMPSNSCNLVIGDRTSTESLCLVDANIQFQTEVAQFANSCSAKAGGWQTCVIGATSCTLNANIHGNHYGIINDAHLPGSNHAVKLYIEGGDVPTVTSANPSPVITDIDETHRTSVTNIVSMGAGHTDETPCDCKAYWEFEKMFFGTFGGLNVDTTTNNPLQFSCAMEFNAYPGGNPGHILYRPSGTIETDTTTSEATAGGITTTTTVNTTTCTPADEVYFIDLAPNADNVLPS